jgi:transcriptional regulator with XRE-family HTH domain
VYEDLAKNLRLLRAERLLTLEEAAKLTGISRITLRSLELGHSEPRWSTINKLAEGYNVDVRDLVGERPTVPKVAPAPDPLVVHVRLRSEFAQFEESLEGLDLPQLEEVGRTLAAEFKEADSQAEAIEIQAQRILVAKAVERLNPPLARINWRPDGTVKVVYLREPKSPEEQEKLDREIERLRDTGRSVEVDHALVVAGV